MIGECHSLEWAFKSLVISWFSVFVRCVRRSVMASLSVCVFVVEFRGGMELLDIVREWLLDKVIFIA